MVEFRSDRRVAFAIDFVAGKSFHPRTRLAAVQDQLLVLDLDIYFPRADFRPGHIGVGETFIQIRTARVILQLSGGLEAQRLRAGARINADQLAQAQIGILQPRLRVNQLRLFVGERDFGAADI